MLLGRTSVLTRSAVFTTNSSAFLLSIEVVDNIFTALLYHAQDQSFGNSETLRPLLEELKSSEDDGITLVIGGKEIVVHIAVCIILGDNLGVHTLQGFVESFRANYPCRTCKISRDASQSQTSLDTSLLGNRKLRNRLGCKRCFQDWDQGKMCVEHIQKFPLHRKPGV